MLPKYSSVGALKPAVGLPTAPSTRSFPALFISQPTTICPAALDEALIGQSPCAAAAPTTPGGDQVAAPARRVEKRMVCVPTPQPGPAHCAHTTIAFPEGSIEATGEQPSPGSVPETRAGKRRPGAARGVLGDAHAGLAAGGLRPRLDADAPVADRDRGPVGDRVAGGRTARASPTMWVSRRRRAAPMRVPARGRATASAEPLPRRRA